MTLPKTLTLKGFSWPELFRADGLARLDHIFLHHLQQENPTLHNQLCEYRFSKRSFSNIETSELLIACAKSLEDFIAELFGIHDEVCLSQAKTIYHNPVSAFKKYFVLRRAKKEVEHASTYPSFAELNIWLEEKLHAAPLSAATDKELSIALLGMQFLENPEEYKADIDQLVKWCVQALATQEGQAVIQNWKSFQTPKRTDFKNLVQTIKECEAHPHDGSYKRLTLAEHNFRLRDGFKLTDTRMNAREVQDEINYCIYCHDHDGDFCSKGFPVKKGDPDKGLRKNPLDNILTGCPLEEKISEMHTLKKDGHSIASLAIIMIDNPMCPATGHRICNDCMKACIYQKQEPVNIPQIETRVLTDVLELPWGVEIYDLLTRWNPLRQKQYVMQSYNGLKILIAGMGPAGFTLAHHLLQEGFAVVGFDGLKIEPLPNNLITQPIQHFSDLVESLDERLMAGFGGVAEYGITVRWDKNFLKLIYLSLLRRPYFQVFGSTRFGGSITVEDAWEMGFDHFVVAVGAGLPKALNIPNSLATGMRQANDFLMALQLGSAAKTSSLTNLQIRLPALVIGGGLTSVDTATELQAYYIRQVEKILNRYEILNLTYDEEQILQQLDISSREILLEFLQHGKVVRHERENAKRENRRVNFIKLIRDFGGVTIVYRRTMQESPAYINNHEELKKALEEGIYYLEGLEPIAVDLDEHGAARMLICQKRIRDEQGQWIPTKEELHLPAKAILVATGTQPNTAYEFEHRGTFNRLNLQYQHYEDENGELRAARGTSHCKEDHFGPFTSYALAQNHARSNHKEIISHQKGSKENTQPKNKYRVSLIGDTHPVFHGSVVKAIASGMRTYPKIVEILKNKSGNKNDYTLFAARMHELFSANIVSITRKSHNVIEMVVKAPLSVKHYKPGQFYRLQNYESSAKESSFTVAHNDVLSSRTLLLMEPLALIATKCDKQHHLLTFNIIESTAAFRLCATLKPGEPIALMGPTGVRAKIPNEHETVLVIGSQSGFPFMRSYGTQLLASGNKVIFLVNCKNKDEIYCQPELEQASSAIIWLTQDAMVNLNRTQDIAFINHDVAAGLFAYAEISSKEIPLQDVDRVFVVGETNLLKQFQAARKNLVKDYLVKDPKVFGSVYGNMQCMMKGVCAQCLQWQIDPETGLRTKAVFACSWQDQPLEIIDINHIDSRIQQNHALEQFNLIWVKHLFERENIERI